MSALRRVAMGFVLVLCAAPLHAQVDWSDLFADEMKPAAPAAKPAAPAARPAAPAAKPPAPAVRPAPAAQPVAKPAPAAAPKPVAQPKPAARPQPVAQPKPAAQPKPVAKPAVVPAAEPEPPVVVAPAPEVAPEPARPAAAVSRPAAPVVAEAESAAVVDGAAAPGADGAGEPALQSRYRLSELGLRDGDTIDASNVDQFKDYLSPGMVWGILYGWKLTVTESKRIELPRRYREATEKYASQVRMGPGGLTLENYIAGQPFPHVDPNDPEAAMKIMWNYYYGPAITDDLDARYFDADTGTIGQGRNMSVERHYIIEHLRRLHYNGRLHVDPKPELPNPEGYRYKESLHPLLEPFDLKGVGFTAYRYLDPARQDDTWLYLPQLRRVRRMSTAQRSDALFGQDTDVDSYYGYNGHIAWNDYRLLGEKVIFGSMHARNVPVKWQEPEDWFFDDVWELRPVWVIEAKSKLPQYAYGKRIIFIDKEGWSIPYSDIYDRAGQLWKIWINMFAFKKEAIPGAKISVYPDDRAFTHAVVMLDTQLVHATKAALPSTKTRGEECIYFDMGDKTGLTEEFFTVAHLIEAGH